MEWSRKGLSSVPEYSLRREYTKARSIISKRVQRLQNKKVFPPALSRWAAGVPTLKELGDISKDELIRQLLPLHSAVNNPYAHGTKAALQAALPDNMQRAFDTLRANNPDRFEKWTDGQYSLYSAAMDAMRDANVASMDTSDIVLRMVDEGASLSDILSHFGL